MLQGLIAVLKTFHSVATAVLEQHKRAETKRQHLALLTARYRFVGVADTGRQLLELTGSRPLDKLMSLPADELRTFSALAQRHISLQHDRLQKMRGLLDDQKVIEIFDPPLRQDIERAIGDKEKGLYAIGAGLLYYVTFISPPLDSSKPEDLEHTAQIICGMYPEIERGVISVPEATTALDELAGASRRYGEVLPQIIPVDRFLPLSKQAARLARVDG